MKANQLINELFDELPETNHLMNTLLKKLNEYENIWEILKDTKIIINHIIDQYPQIKVRNEKCMGMVHFEGDDIYIGQGTTIQHGSFIRGPCIIGKNCQIRKGAYIRGNAIIGDKTLIGNSSEIKNSILLGQCQIAHFNYIGDSILGYKAHFSAGAITSNLKLNSSEINILIGEGKEPIKTDMIKIGGLVGNNTEIGCNTILNPGAVIGRNSVIYPQVNFRGYLGPNKICKLLQTQQVVEKI